MVERALALFPDSAPPSDRDERIALLDELTGRAGGGLFEALDSAFYAIPENVDSLLAAYVAAHAAEIARARDDAPDV